MAYYDGDNVCVSGIGKQKPVKQLMQAFVWMSCAIRAEFTSRDVWECIPIFFPVKLANQPARLKLFFAGQFVRQLASTASTVRPGECWRNMFQGAVIARGFPTSQRKIKGLGLEVPLNMLSYFGGSKRVAEWKDKMFIKGYSTMLVAVKCVANIVVWHYYYLKKGERLSYTHCNEETERFSITKLEGFRHVIGWCSKSKYFAGETCHDCLIYIPTHRFRLSGSELRYWGHTATAAISWILPRKGIHIGWKNSWWRSNLHARRQRITPTTQEKWNYPQA